MEYFPYLLVGDVVVDDFGHSDAEDVADRTVPEYVEFVDV